MSDEILGSRGSVEGKLGVDRFLLQYFILFIKKTSSTFLVFGFYVRFEEGETRIYLHRKLNSIIGSGKEWVETE